MSQFSGERVPVLVHPRGGGPLEHRGTIVLEDLTGVLSHLATRRGPSGPQGVVTQFILAEGAATLHRELTQDLSVEGESAPRILSALVGHEPFMDRIELSVQHMRRRWPAAQDWYADLVSYILRPSRFAENFRLVHAQLPSMCQGSLGRFAEELARQQLEVSYPLLFELPTIIEVLWPDYPPVRESVDAYTTSHTTGWGAIYDEVFTRYGLRLRDGGTLDDIAWALAALLTAEQHARRLEAPWCATEPVGARTVRMAMVTLAGAVTTLSGDAIDAADLAHRMPTGAHP